MDSSTGMSYLQNQKKDYDRVVIIIHLCNAQFDIVCIQICRIEAEKWQYPRPRFLNDKSDSVNNPYQQWKSPLSKMK